MWCWTATALQIIRGAGIFWLSSHERAIFEHGALRKVRVNFKCSLHHCFPPQKAGHSKLCRLSSATIFSWLKLVTYPSILQLAANILLPLTITLSAPVSTVGNAVMGSVSKLVKVGDFVYYVVNAGSSVGFLPIHFIYLLKIPL